MPCYLAALLLLEAKRFCVALYEKFDKDTKLLGGTNERTEVYVEGGSFTMTIIKVSEVLR